MSLLSPNARALARMPEEERRRIAWERFQEHLRKQKRIHEVENASNTIKYAFSDRKNREGEEQSLECSRIGQEARR